MKPVSFKGQNVVFGENQPEYRPLPAIRLPDGQVITCWELTEEEVQSVVNTKRLFISQMTFNTPLQPILPAAELDQLFDLEN